MDYEAKIEKWLEFAKTKGIPKSAARPLPDKMLAAMGFRFPPFLFWNFFGVAFVIGSQFGLFWGTFMYFTVWGGKPIINIVIASVGVGVPFGLCMAVFFFWRKRKWALPSWDAFNARQ